MRRKWLRAKVTDDEERSQAIKQLQEFIQDSLQGKLLKTY